MKTKAPLIIFFSKSSKEYFLLNKKAVIPKPRARKALLNFIHTIKADKTAAKAM